MRVGCAAYSYRERLSKGEMTLLDFLDRCAEMGADGAELTAYYFPDTERGTLNRLKREALLRGLDISGAAVGNNFCLAEESERRAQIQMTLGWLEHAARLGAPMLRVFAGSVPKGGSEEQARRWTVSALQECAERAAELGVMLALENHGGITAAAEQTCSLLDAVGSEWVGLNLDTGNYRDDPYGSIRRSAPRAVGCHAKSEIPGAAGKESADLARIVSDLEEAGYRGYLTIEYEAAGDPLTEIPVLAAELRRYARVG